MPYVTKELAASLSEFARDVLGQSEFGAANVRRAASFATAELARRTREEIDPQKQALMRAAGFDNESPASIGANRRLLNRIAYEGKKEQKLIQEKKFDLAWNLLLCLPTGKTGGRTRRSPVDPQLKRAWEKTITDSEWTHPASGHEAARLRSEDGLPGWVRDQITGFEKWAQDRHHDEHRIMLAVHRLLAPFCASARTSGIERSFAELTPLQQKTVIYQSIAIERAWLGEQPLYKRTWRPQTSETLEEFVSKVFTPKRKGRRAKSRA